MSCKYSSDFVTFVVSFGTQKTITNLMMLQYYYDLFFLFYQLFFSFTKITFTKNLIFCIFHPVLTQLQLYDWIINWKLKKKMNVENDPCQIYTRYNIFSVDLFKTYIEVKCIVLLLKVFLLKQVNHIFKLQVFSKTTYMAKRVWKKSYYTWKCILCC